MVETQTQLAPAQEALRFDLYAYMLERLDAAAGIRALVFNLVSNAVRACSEGGEIALVARRTEEGTLLDFTVSDTGCGMSPEVLSRCREMFFSTRSHGSGIGLTLCDRLIVGAGETMTISSEESKGTQVRRRLPLPET